MPKERLSHSVVRGSNLQDFNKQAQLRKAFLLEVDKITIIKIRWHAQGKRLILLDFIFTYLMLIRWET
jgi:hypothetical protein